MFKRKLLNIGHGRLKSLKNNAMNIIEYFQIARLKYDHTEIR